MSVGKLQITTWLSEPATSLSWVLGLMISPPRFSLLNFTLDSHDYHSLQWSIVQIEHLTQTLVSKRFFFFKLNKLAELTVPF